MNKRDAVLDASFWINLHRAGLIEALLDYFNLFAPTKVIEEIEHTPPDVDQLTLAGETFKRWRQTGKLTIQDPHQPVNWFDPGENAAIGLAQERGYVLLIDDQAPYHLTKKRKLRSVASVDFIVLLYADYQLSYDEAQAILARSEIAKHLKRAAMTALGFLARQRSEHDDDCTS